MLAQTRDSRKLERFMVYPHFVTVGCDHQQVYWIMRRESSYATFRYSLDKKKDSWVGTAKWVFSDGKVREGQSVVEKMSQDKWEWRASFTSNGETHTYRAINRRVK